MWKWIGLAGVVGAVAVGVTVGARQYQRTHREFIDADIVELRDRLHARFAQIPRSGQVVDPPSGPISDQ